LEVVAETSKMAPEAILIDAEFAIDPDEPKANVPVLIVVDPVKVFTPDKITLLVVAPVFTICNGFAPLITPETLKVPVVALPDVPI
jgi:hypothetical protein